MKDLNFLLAGVGGQHEIAGSGQVRTSGCFNSLFESCGIEECPAQSIERHFGCEAVVLLQNGVDA